MDDQRVRDPRRESIYGPITEHPEYPVTDGRRFTVQYHPHLFGRPVGRLVEGRTCAWCPFPRVHPIHPQQAP